MVPVIIYLINNYIIIPNLLRWLPIIQHETSDNKYPLMQNPIVFVNIGTTYPCCHHHLSIDCQYWNSRRAFGSDGSWLELVHKMYVGNHPTRSRRRCCRFRRQIGGRGGFWEAWFWLSDLWRMLRCSLFNVLLALKCWWEWSCFYICTMSLQSHP